MNTNKAINDLSISQLGEIMAASGLFGDTRSAAQAIVKILAGQELGFGPIASMTGINIIRGRVTLSANLLAAAVKRHARYDYRVTRLDNDACEIAFYQDGNQIGLSVFSMDDAKRAGLSSKEIWKQYPRNMLFARALSNGARMFCPDVASGVYTPEELDAVVDADGEVISLPVESPKPPTLLTSGGGDQHVEPTQPVIEKPAGNGARAHSPTPPQKPPTPAQNAPDRDPNQPWQEVIAEWDETDWAVYERTVLHGGLTHDDMTRALGTDIRQFAGTRGDVYALMRRMRELKARKPGFHWSPACTDEYVYPGETNTPVYQSLLILAEMIEPDENGHNVRVTVRGRDYPQCRATYVAKVSPGGLLHLFPDASPGDEPRELLRPGEGEAVWLRWLPVEGNAIEPLEIVREAVAKAEL